MNWDIESIKKEIDADRLKFVTCSNDHKTDYMALLREYTPLLVDAQSEWKKAPSDAKWKKKESVFEKYMALSRYLATGSWIQIL